MPGAVVYFVSSSFVFDPLAGLAAWPPVGDWGRHLGPGDVPQQRKMKKGPSETSERRLK